MSQLHPQREAFFIARSCMSLPCSLRFPAGFPRPFNLAPCAGGFVAGHCFRGLVKARKQGRKNFGDLGLSLSFLSADAITSEGRGPSTLPSLPGGTREQGRIIAGVAWLHSASG